MDTRSIDTHIDPTVYVLVSDPCCAGFSKMIVFKYKSKKELKASVGKPLNYIETSMFEPEYQGDGTMTGANRPHITGLGREFFARVTMQNGLIKSVE